MNYLIYSNLEINVLQISTYLNQFKTDDTIIYNNSLEVLNQNETKHLHLIIFYKKHQFQF